MFSSYGPRPAEWRQLCAIARRVIEAAPTLDDAEWKARIKDLLIAQGYDYAEQRDLMEKAMRAVEHVLELQWGPRPPAAPPVKPQPRIEAAQADPPWRGYQRRSSAGFTSLKDIIEDLRKPEKDPP